MLKRTLYESLKNVDRAKTELWVDGHAKDLLLLGGFTQLQSLHFYRLSKRNITNLANLQLPQLEELSLRLGSFSDLLCISHLTGLKRLFVWQCFKLRSLEGLAPLTGLRHLTLREIGTIDSLEPIASLVHLEELIIKGGIFSKQALPCFQPIAQLGRKLKILDLVGGKTEHLDLTSLTRLPEPDEFGISVRFYPLEQVALLAAAYPNWGDRLMKLEYPGVRQCKKCSGPTRMLLDARSKDVCPKCDSARMDKYLSEFRSLVKQKKEDLNR